MSRSSWFDGKDYFLLFFVSFFFFLYLLPIYPGMPAVGLDPSWSNTINYALLNDLKFGSDILFTYGPLGSFRFPEYVYSEKTYYIAVSISIIFSIIVSLSLYFITKPVPSLTKIVGLVAVISGLVNGGLIFWYLIPVLFIVIGLKDADGKVGVLPLLLVLIMAFSILVKFSHLPIVFISVFLADIYLYKNRGKPVFTLWLVSSFLLLYLLAGQDFTDFLNYFSGSFSTLSGYSESMSSFGPIEMVYAFLALFVSMSCILLVKLYESSSVKVFLISLVCFLVLFLSFKQGFVRHDAHAISAFSGMSIVFGILFFIYSKYLSTRLSYGLTLLLVCLSVVSSYEVRAFYSNTNISGLVYNELRSYKNRLYDMPSVFFSERLAELNSQYSKANIRIRGAVDLPAISGTVDIYPWDQSYVIANNLKFTPRPLFQSYSVYTDSLIQRNIDFLESERAAENILFKIQEIDGRLPSTMEGASWLEILSGYNPVNLVGEFLHLRKSEFPREFKLIPRDKLQAGFGQVVKSPNYTTFVNIDIKKNFLGKLANIFYKNPLLKIQLNFSDGTSQTSRIVPAIVRNGFVLNPYISDSAEFYRFSIGAQAGKKVESFRIINTDDCCYSNIIDIQFKEVELNLLDIERTGNLKALDFMYEIQNSSTNKDLLGIRSYKNKKVIFSHVGIDFEVTREKLLEIASDGLVPVYYGFFESAYTGNNKSDGGCFSVYKEKKSERNLLHHSCLNPRANAEDRKENTFNIDVNNSVQRYIFEVTPRDGYNASWGWSYWRF